MSKEPSPRPPLVSLACGSARADISPLGAEIQTWRIDGRELLWRRDPAAWPRTAPILFPIVGRLRNDRLKVGGVETSMGVHGFAASSLFEIDHACGEAARFALRDDSRTRAIFPFAFRLLVEHRLGENALTTRLIVENPGKAPLLYACGLHPGFRWPFDGGAADAYRIEFDADETPFVPEIAAGGLFSAERRAIPLEGRNLRVDHALLEREALCFLNARSHALRFVAPSGRAISLDVHDFPHLALWSRPPAPFLCLEAWTGHGDPVDFSGELADKPSMRSLAPGERAEHWARWRFG